MRVSLLHVACRQCSVNRLIPAVSSVIPGRKTKHLLSRCSLKSVSFDHVLGTGLTTVRSGWGSAFYAKGQSEVLVLYNSVLK